MQILKDMKKYMMAAVVCCLTLPACNRQTDTLLEEALQLAGNNRPELEKVLAHYEAEGDPQKLEAAKILIRNMPGHYSYADTTVLIPFYDAVDSLLTAMKGTDKWVIRDSLVSAGRKFAHIEAKKVQDVQVITSGFLIQNIDSAFVQWREGAWARHLDFDSFCEYLLPYKAEELQPLDGWRTHLRTFHPDHLDELTYCDLYRNSSIKAGIVLNDNLWYYMQPGISEENMQKPVYRWRTRLRIPVGTCADFGAISTSVFRSQGIPVAMDFTPQWAFRSLGHSWNILVAEDGRNLPFSGATSEPGQPHKLGERMAKVFRRTYAMNPELRRLLGSDGFVPMQFRNPFIKDVTEEYMDCRDITLDLPKGTEAEYAYLTVFDNRNWVPVDFARIEGGKVTFRKVGMNTVYLPVCYNPNGSQEAIAAPFLFAYGGQVRPITADTISRTSLTLLRKYPVLPYVHEIVMRIDSGQFQASNDARFKEKTILHTITDCSVTGKEILLPDTLLAYRYWRFYQPKEGTYCNIADIRFYEKGKREALKGKIIGTDGHWEGNPDGTKDKAFDDDLLTFFDAPLSSGAWVGMDFGQPVRLGRIVYTARGDGNSIDIGDQYELFYWDGKGWTSLGKQAAETIRLEYRDVPSGGLYWLRNLSKGKDERIFTYENGKQVWW